MHPILADIIRCKDVPRIAVLRLWQQQLRDVIAPLVDAGEAHRSQPGDTGAKKSARVA